MADGVLVSEREEVPVGASPWALARRRLLRNRIAMVMLGVLVVIVLACLAAPLYAHDIAHTNPFQSNLDGTTIVNGKSVPVMPPSTTGLGLGSTPIGPTWDPAHYFLGADDQGRDVAARLLYGGRNSLLIGTSAALVTTQLATSMPGAGAATKLAYSAAAVAFLVYAVGFTASFWLPEPKQDRLME